MICFLDIPIFNTFKRFIITQCRYNIFFTGSRDPTTCIYEVTLLNLDYRFIPIYYVLLDRVSFKNMAPILTFYSVKIYDFDKNIYKKKLII